ncbi:leucine-rich repeat domain-containing protein [Candidatus Saccharibacteria bacterium]|mgnify:CR=1 FL=1|nr:leucine-rich repeat domain-containing protein [Candidatus Saccharibacteria bacterium]
MKYIVIVAVAILIFCGIAVGYTLGINSQDSNDTSQSGSSRSSANATVLDQSSKGLTTVSPSIYEQTATTDLLLSNNDIETLPSQMGKMTNVVVFKIDHNHLQGSLIAEIRQMTKLVELDVSHNDMTGIPAEIGQLSRLQKLDYSYNKINSLPSELANLHGTLKEFDLTGNPLSQETISKLKSQLPGTNIIF